MAGLTLSLMKIIAGSGVLCLSGGLAAATNDPRQLLPAVLASLFFALLSAYTFALTGFVCSETGATTYGQAWASTVSRSSAWIPEIVVTTHTAILCALYSVILGDVAHELAMFIPALPPVWRDRNFLLWLLALTIQLPLCLLRSLVALSWSSAVGVCGIMYTIGFMAYRYFEGEYKEGGELWQLLDLHERPVFGKRTSVVKSAILLAMLNTCYQAHYAAPSFVQAIPDGSQAAFKAVTYTGFLLSGVLGSLILGFGFLTFGGSCQPLILNSFVTADKLAVFARSATLLSLLAGYPLLFRGFASGLYELQGITEPSPRRMHRTAVATVFATTALAMVMRDLGLLCSLAGALFGSAIIYVFPALMHARLLLLQKRERLLQLHTAQHEDASMPRKGGAVAFVPYYGSVSIIGIGSVLGVLGIIVPLLQAYTDLLD